MKRQLRNYQAVFGIFDKWNISLLIYFIAVVGGLVLQIRNPQTGGISTIAVVIESTMFAFVPMGIANSFKAKQAIISTMPLIDKEIADITVIMPKLLIFPALIVSLIICVVMKNEFLALLQISKSLLTLAAIYFSLIVTFKTDLKKTTVSSVLSYLIVYIAIYSYGFFIFVILVEFTFSNKIMIYLIALNIFLIVLVIVARYLAKKNIARQLKRG